MAPQRNGVVLIGHESDRYLLVRVGLLSELLDGGLQSLRRKRRSQLEVLSSVAIEGQLALSAFQRVFGDQLEIVETSTLLVFHGIFRSELFLKGLLVLDGPEFFHREAGAQLFFDEELLQLVLVVVEVSAWNHIRREGKRVVTTLTAKGSGNVFDVVLAEGLLDGVPLEEFRQGFGEVFGCVFLALVHLQERVQLLATLYRQLLQIQSHLGLGLGLEELVSLYVLLEVLFEKGFEVATGLLAVHDRVHLLD